MRLRICIILIFQCFFLQGQNPLYIPPTLSGTTFNLDVQNGITQFFTGINTPTFGVNGNLLAPTLVINKWDWVTMNVTNNLTGTGNSTTMHWHGLHVPAMDDGGPHQIILQSSTWSPNFQVLNSAGTFWYHPHGANKTDLQISKGIAGMIIVKDSAETALTLPRTYGIDDFPLIVQTKSFDVLNQIAISTAFDTVPMVNGTVNPYLDAPAQVVRLRLLNAASDRSFLFGFSNNMNFHLIASDGGLLDSSLTLTRLRLSNGERAEILVDLSTYLNDTISLMSYGAELPNGIVGADSVGDAANQIPDYYSNFLNGANFNLLQINVVAQTGNPVTTIPTTLTTLSPWNTLNATVYRTFELDTLSDGFVIPNLAEGPFGINTKSFDMDSINETIYLNTTEIWTLKNKTRVAHPFHIHDVHFYILDANGNSATGYQKGKKDVVLVMPLDSIRFITKFEDFANDTVPYMYHCHLLHHEDDGMMGSFLVISNPNGNYEINMKQKINVYPNPFSDKINISVNDNVSLNLTGIIYNVQGRVVGSFIIPSDEKFIQLDLSELSNGIYAVRLNDNKNVFIRTFVKQ
ncbi:MAG TPA: multicopper oxidase domain-containing protein [Bacteroidia bacterium]|nr:multicopper oxidase domain-containing protein [Bacteroidia bacterium]